jgi:hypothetical protein
MSLKKASMSLNQIRRTILEALNDSDAFPTMPAIGRLNIQSGTANFRLSLKSQGMHLRAGKSVDLRMLSAGQNFDLEAARGAKVQIFVLGGKLTVRAYRGSKVEILSVSGDVTIHGSNHCNVKVTNLYGSVSGSMKKSGKLSVRIGNGPVEIDGPIATLTQEEPPQE